LLQYAVSLKAYQFVSFLLNQSFYQVSNKKQIPIDRRVTVGNSYVDNDPTFTIRLAISNGWDYRFYELLSNCEKFLSGSDYLTLARFAVFTKKTEFLNWIFYSCNAYSTWRNFKPVDKKKILEIVS
jgi:hypothetical protein